MISRSPIWRPSIRVKVAAAVPALCLMLIFLHHPYVSAQKAAQKAEKESPSPSNSDEVEIETIALSKIQDRFERGLAAWKSQDGNRAAPLFWQVVANSPKGTPKSELAQFFLAEIFAQEGFKHAALTFYLDVIASRAEPILLERAIQMIQEMTAEPHDNVQVRSRLILDPDLGGLPQDLQAWLEYRRGLLEFRAGNLEWAKRHFARIDPKSSIGAQAQFVLAVHRLQSGRKAQAQAKFEALAKHPKASLKITYQAQTALARMAYDAQDFELAWQHYPDLDPSPSSNVSIFAQAQVLLERAWTAYHIGEHNRAMGILHALHAPIYFDLYLPDAYILRAIILKDLCHPLLAKQVLQEFMARYQNDHDAIIKRIPAQNIPALNQAMYQEAPLTQAFDFSDLLQTEQAELEKKSRLWQKTGLYQALSRLYRRSIHAHDLRQEEYIHDATAKVGEVFLAHWEAMHLLDYEIDIQIAQKTDAKDTAKWLTQAAIAKPGPQKNLKHAVVYPFDGEFWNDEIHRYTYDLKDRCPASFGFGDGGAHE